MLSIKQSGLHKGGNECYMKKRWRRSARKIRKRYERGLKKWNVGRRRNVRLTGRESERGPAVLRKQGLKLLGRENIPGALSKAPPCNPGNLNSLRRVRFSSNTRLPCCTCHSFSLFK